LSGEGLNMARTLEHAQRSPLEEHVGILLVPEFPLLCFSSALDAMRQLNRIAGETLYRWEFFSLDGEPVRCSAGIELPVVGPLSSCDGKDLLLVIAGQSDHCMRAAEDPRSITELRRIARGGCTMAGLSLGSFMLAQAGLLVGHRCTVHWENLESFRERFPQLDVTPEVFERDDKRMTCSGGTAALDMMLHYAAEQHGQALAGQAAEVFMHERIRDNQDHQRMPLRARLGISHPKLLQAIELIESNTDRPHSQLELARSVGLSSRQVERLFRRYLSTTPRQYALDHRLRRARTLLRTTSLGVLEVALAVGFATASHFTKSYRDYFGVTPTQDRSLGPAPEGRGRSVRVPQS
jgi:transcriptional regulator GlxA family with amidase domain